jgi:hypothetical protein
MPAKENRYDLAAIKSLLDASGLSGPVLMRRISDAVLAASCEGGNCDASCTTCRLGCSSNSPGARGDRSTLIRELAAEIRPLLEATGSGR